MSDGYNNNNSEDTRRALYDRFRATIGRRDRSDYFDEDDIIEIYDYASDYNDDFTKIEALLYGARMFPDSESLKIRRDYLYYYLGYDEAVATMLERRDKPTLLSTLLGLHRRADAGEATTDELDALINSLDHKMDDEEIIRFTDIAGANAANYKWLVANVERLKAFVEYPVTFLYEVTGVAEEMADYDTALKYADELTMLEPFNIEFWQLLASLNHNAGNHEGAVVAADYALALDPADAVSKRIKGLAIYESGGDTDKAIDLLVSVVAEPGFDASCITALAQMLISRSRRDEANDLLRRFNRANPDDRTVVDFILMTDPDFAATILPAHMTGSDDASDWRRWAISHAARGHHRQAVVILNEALRRKLLGENLGLLYEELYLDKRYKAVTDLYETRRAIGEKPGNEGYLSVIMALIRQQRKEEAIAVTEGALRDVRPLDIEQEDMPSRLPYVFYVQGIMSMLVNIRLALNSPDNLPPDDFDPFRYIAAGGDGE